MAAARNPALSLALPARAENIAVIRQALGGVAEELGASPQLIDDIKTAASEAATNVVVHAYREEEGPVEVLANARGSRLEIVIRDRGIGMQPRPLSPDEPSLRVGLPLIGALASQVEIQGEHGTGTEVRIVFDLDHEEHPGAYETELSDVDADQTRLAIGGSSEGGAAIPKVLELLAARSNLDLDRLADVQLVADFLSHWNAGAAVDSKPFRLSISERDDTIEIRVGPLEPGLGRKMLQGGDLPGFGNTLERVVDSTEIEETGTDAGPAEFLVMEITSKTPHG